MPEDLRCPLYKKCGGCQLQNLSYEEQLEWKQRKVKGLLSKFGKVEKIIGMDEPYHYRNKVQAAFGSARNGEIISGVYQSGTHRIVPVDTCLTEDKTADEIIVHIRNLMRSFKIKPYNEQTGNGTIRHVLVKRGFTSGEIMVVLVTSSPILPAKNNFVKAILRAFPGITTIIHNINPNILNPNDASFWSPNPNQFLVKILASYTKTTPDNVINNPIILNIICNIFCLH